MYGLMLTKGKELSQSKHIELAQVHVYTGGRGDEKERDGCGGGYLNFLSSLTYLASRESGSQSNWPCQKYLVFRVSLMNLETQQRHM